jgi:hypothetical protein
MTGNGSALSSRQQSCDRVNTSLGPDFRPGKIFRFPSALISLSSAIVAGNESKVRSGRIISVAFACGVRRFDFPAHEARKVVVNNLCLGLAQMRFSSFLIFEFVLRLIQRLRVRSEGEGTRRRMDPHFA